MTINKEELTNEAIAKLLDWTSATESFVAEQAPLLAREIINWGIYCGIITFAVLLALLTGIVFFGVFLTKKSKHIEVHVLSALVATEIFALLTMAFLIVVGTVEAIYPAFKAYFAPRLYLIEQLSSMVN